MWRHTSTKKIKFGCRFMQYDFHQNGLWFITCCILVLTSNIVYLASLIDREWTNLISFFPFTMTYKKKNTFLLSVKMGISISNYGKLGLWYYILMILTFYYYYQQRTIILHDAAVLFMKTIKMVLLTEISEGDHPENNLIF